MEDSMRYNVIEVTGGKNAGRLCMTPLPRPGRKLKLRNARIICSNVSSEAGSWFMVGWRSSRKNLTQKSPHSVP